MSANTELEMTKKKKQEMLWGALEGIAMGAVLGLCTGGIGWLLIPACMVWRIFDKRNKINYLFKRSIECKDGINSETTVTDMAWNIGTSTLGGAAIGASIGLLLSGFTFGLSIPIGAAIGALYGMADAVLNEYVVHKTFQTSKRNNPFLMANQGALIGSLGGAAIGLGVLLAPFTAGASLLFSIAIVAGSTLLSAAAGYHIAKGVNTNVPNFNVSKNSVRNATLAGTSSGAIAGALVGAFFIPITFGLSIPICALIGAFAGGTLLGLAERFGLRKKVMQKIHDDNGTIDSLRNNEESLVDGSYNSSYGSVGSGLGVPYSVMNAGEEVHGKLEQLEQDARLLEPSRTPTSPTSENFSTYLRGV